MIDREKLDKRLISYVEVFLIANKLETVVNKGMHEITAKQWLPLIMLGTLKEAPTLKELSLMCGISHQSTKQLVKKLEEKGYVHIEEDKKDKRAMRISVTSKFDEWVKKYSKRNYNFVYEVFSCLSDEEIDTMFTAQRKLLSKLSEIYEEVKKNEL